MRNFTKLSQSLSRDLWAPSGSNFIEGSTKNAENVYNISVGTARKVRLSERRYSGDGRMLNRITRLSSVVNFINICRGMWKCYVATGLHPNVKLDCQPIFTKFILDLQRVVENSLPNFMKIQAIIYSLVLGNLEKEGIKKGGGDGGKEGMKGKERGREGGRKEKKERTNE